MREIRPKFIVSDELCLDRITEAIRDFDFVQEIFVIGKTNGYTSVDDLLLKNETGKYLQLYSRLFTMKLFEDRNISIITYPYQQYFPKYCISRFHLRMSRVDRYGL